MNELKELCERLSNSNFSEYQFLITKAEKTENGWNLTVQTVNKLEAAKNESNK